MKWLPLLILCLLAFVGCDPDSSDARDLGGTHTPTNNSTVDVGGNDVDDCVAESDADFCLRLGAECGPLTADDNCGLAREVHCGADADVCGPSESCVDNICACDGETVAEICERHGADCGELSDTNSCGTTRVVNCDDVAGACPTPTTCGGGGQDNVCGCTSDPDDVLCEAAEAVCGELTLTDNCGASKIIDCGDGAEVCTEFETCGGGETPNVCGCTPESIEELCEQAGADCGQITLTDNCGEERNVDCGDGEVVCEVYETCGGGGEENVCGCTADPDETLCEAAGAECGEVTLTDNCGEEQTINCGREIDVCIQEFDTCGGGELPNVCGCTPTTCEAEQVLCGEISDGCGGTLECDYFCVEVTTSGASHTCALGSGNVKCWGLNNKGQLGDGTTTLRRNPVDVTGLFDIEAIAAGGTHTCAILANSAVKCWGGNNRSQLGVGTTVDSSVPGNSAIISGATQIVAGADHTCALVNGGVRCWGSNDFGQIGNAAIDPGTNVGVPIEVTGLTAGVTMITAGAYHNCAVLDDESVQCWGRNRYGQVGNLEPNFPGEMEAFTQEGNENLDVLTRQRTPVPVTGLTGIVSITAGADHSCAVDINSNAWCWGAMQHTYSNQRPCEQVGDRNPSACAIFPPEVEEGETPLGYPMFRYTASPDPDEGKTCTNDDAASVCRRSGTCINGQCEGITTYSVQAVYIDRAALYPIQVNFANDGTFPVAHLGSGANHACLISSVLEPQLSNIRCFGVNEFGQLGDGTNNYWQYPVRVFYDVNDLVVRGVSLSQGNNFSCAVVDDSNVKCWGSNQNGQIGNSALDRDESYRPFDVKLEYTP